MLRFEREALSRFDLVLAVSEADGAHVRAPLSGRTPQPVHVVKTGVDTTYFAPLPEVPVRRAHIVFTGSMDWLPNEDGMVYFVREILPLDPPQRAGRHAQHHRPLAHPGGAAARRGARR